MENTTPVSGMEYPELVCDQCGLEANRLTCLDKFGKEPLKAKFDHSTYHQGLCDVCKRERAVTEPRDYFYPNFNLLPRDWLEKLRSKHA